MANCSFGPADDIRWIVPAMHGYAHNRPCQLGYHPLYVDGTGLEDFEQCERAFSASNELARTTRHANAFHRHQSIHHHYRHWDKEKTANLGNFIYNNYVQALRVRADCGDALATYETRKPGFSREVIPQWLEEEREYLAGLQKEPEGDTLRVEYVTALDELRAAE